ncbi:hypothetical protein M9194_11910 [Vibrio sp. S4M6]|uniref:DUF6966 domain-containing protein n=1 Tax=Vibrio sinus TaxID=2946865 RepID=UPI00202A1D0E|nr:hypothetical protein [Vibrio sinus]MCL9782132.1 hypothetical protein [Vibrio sinus]
MGPRTKKLVLELEKAVELLRSCSENHWADWLTKSANLLRRGQFSGIEHFEGAFGGMGSINDLVLTPINGHTMQKSEVDFYNEKLLSHLSIAQGLIKEIRDNMEVN